MTYYLNELKNQNKITEYQVQGIQFLIEKKRCILADEMGLGKTRQAFLSVLVTKQFPLIIVCPVMLLGVWLRELGMFIDINEVQVITKNSIEKDKKIYILGYERCVILLKVLKEIQYNSLIIDEAHYIKNPESQRTQSVFDLIRNNKTCLVFLLTGTPLWKTPADLQTLLGICHEYFRDRDKFLQRYCGKPIWNLRTFKLEYKGLSNEDELKGLLPNVMIRRTKSQFDLPSKTKIQIPLYIENIPDPPPQESSDLGKLVLYLQELALIKTDYIIEFAKRFDNCIIFGYFVDALEKIKNGLPSSELLTGEHNIRNKDKIVDGFQQRKFNYLVASSVLWTGFTLTATNVILFVDLLWTPNNLKQAEDRIHRLGQTKDVLIYYFVIYDSLEEVIWNVMQKRLDMCEELGL
jgi:SWI/SNF-related matrix-associated actin-dependent regulator 1 of chromatin subfamily A